MMLVVGASRTLLWSALLFVAVLHAQTSMPVGILNGRFVAWSGSASSGELTVRNPQNRTYSCRYDARTYVERSNEPIAVTGLSANDPVEVLADRQAGSADCYTRMVHVVSLRPVHRVDAFAGRLPEQERPRGDLPFNGVVTKIGPGLMTLRTRAGEVRISLSSDTRYIAGGVNRDRAALTVNVHVFVRAGRNLDGDIEAYQVVWGNIVEPQ